MASALLAIRVSAACLFLFIGQQVVHGQGGVRLSLNENDVVNGSTVSTAMIGPNRGNPSGEGLQCITDLRPCCRQAGSQQMLMGEWYYPNGSMVPGNEGGDVFFRTRGLNDGTVNLFQRNSGVSPVGSYCCEIPDMNNTNQTLCANVAPPGFAFQINGGRGSPGRNHTLLCNITANGISNVIYKWKNNGSDVEQQTESTLFFSFLRLSDAGPYTCAVTFTVSGQTYSATQQHVIIVQIPAPTSVMVTSDQPNPIQDIGSNVTLTCTVELSPAVDVPVTVNTVWTGPDGFMATNTAQPDMGSNTTYISLSTIVSFGNSNTGVYECRASIILQPSVSRYISNSSTTSGSLSLRTDSATGGGSTAAAAAAVSIVIIVVLAVVVIIVVIVFIWWRRRKSGIQQKNLPPPRPKPPRPVAYHKTNTVRESSTKIRGNMITKFPSDTTVVEGEGVYFKIKVSGVPQPTVTWYHDGEPVKADYAREIEKDGSLAIPSTELKHSGVYKAVVANQYGSEEREVKLTVSEEGGASTAAVAADETVSSRPIPISEFGKYVSELHANSNQPFKDLYQSLDSGEEGRSTSYAVSGGRKPLNRFGNIVVYDDNRIALTPLSEAKDCQGDYINACYIDGYSITEKFIATQGPLPKTVVDFWRLVWQKRPPTIVMVTNVKEGTRIKCQQYWPDSGKKEFGPFEVTMTDKQEFADYSVRTLSVSLGSGRSHKVTQYHFTAWPDHGVPDYATPILAFHKRVKAQHHPSRGPMVVHCSAGVGRTGTFIVIDNILEQIEKEQVVDIPGAVTKIRQKRMKMVQTHEQFTFIHDAILESVTCGDTQIAATNLRVSIAKMKKTNNNTHINGFEQQFKVLEQVSPNPDELQCSSARSYPDKNKGDKFLPADKWRVILTGEQPDYINAVNINGYKRKKAFIIAQSPMKNTVRNFWKIIYDRKCAVIVMLSDLVEEGQEASAQYWPNSGMTPYEEYTVDLLGEEKLEGFTIREISVLEAKAKKAHKVTQFHITCWTADGRCSNLRSITDVIEEMTKVQIRSGNKPIVVHCNDTVTRSGMFCAIATTIERCKTEGVVDVFQVVKALRVQKPGAVPTVDNFKQLFDTILVYLESFDTYANFQNI